MRILFLTGQAHLPQSFGGVQSSTETTICHLNSAGHECAVACALWGGDRFALAARLKMRIYGTRNVIDTKRGYPVYRSWDPIQNANNSVARFRPDVAVVQHSSTVQFIEQLHTSGIPIVVYLRNLEFDELGGDLADMPPHVRYIANSQFTARSYHERFGIDPIVLPPLIDPARYRTQPGSYVTMINPAAEKGIDVTLSLIERCRQIPFLIVEGWGGDKDIIDRIEKLRLSGCDVRLVKKTDDMRAIYSQTRILLAPSLWEEAWGRVASEAHVSGIPVIGSDRGGLPEAIGPGGRILPHDAPVERWEETSRVVE